MPFLKNLYLTSRFFWVFGIIIGLFVVAFGLRISGGASMGYWLFSLAKTILLVAGAITLADILLLFNPGLRLRCERFLPRTFSLGDVNHVEIKVSHNYVMPLNFTLIDELPDQFQSRDFDIRFRLPYDVTKTVSYDIKPLTRGEYIFHNTNLFVRSIIGLAERRKVYNAQTVVPVYPSVLQMKQFELSAFTRVSSYQGVKKMRRIGHSYEFEQIRNYVKGDDYRSINWKATSRSTDMKVNQYEDEKSQQIYCLIDKSRSMRMPFNGMSLLDYAINTTLVISNIALQRQDRAGLLTFSDKIGTALKADNTPGQLRRILESLYKEEERRIEANFEVLYAATKTFIKRRSLLFLYTNFESYHAMQRVLPLLRQISGHHLLVVVFFENTEMADFINEDVDTVLDIYNETTARYFMSEKTRIVSEIRQYGIQCILSRPEDLSVNTINKYLELKAKGLI